MTKYLSPDPMVFGQFTQRSDKLELVKESGGPSHQIADEDKCPSGRHNKRLTECFCE
jgi:hypothetical protein